MYVTAADHDKDSDDHTEIRIVSESIHLHPGYVNSGLRRDVAIVKLSEALPIGDRGSNRAFKVRGRTKNLKKTAKVRFSFQRIQEKCLILFSDT